MLLISLGSHLLPIFITMENDDFQLRTSKVVERSLASETIGGYSYPIMSLCLHLPNIGVSRQQYESYVWV